ncbi:MAG: YkoF family thiamine/hydroxymethylpyrimidine-binding protein [Armatimonadota bacterium]
MPVISAQIALYPLRTAHLGPAIDAFADVLRNAGLRVEPGPMSTLVVGEADALFAALQSGFEAASAEAEVVMQVTVSNACPCEM